MRVGRAKVGNSTTLSGPYPYLFRSVVLDHFVVGTEVESGHEPVDWFPQHREILASPVVVLQREPLQKIEDNNNKKTLARKVNTCKDIFNVPRWVGWGCILQQMCRILFP